MTLLSGTTAFTLLSNPTGAETLVAKANPEDLDYNTATDDQKNQMWTFSHEATEQLGATTDYRYIGANPNNYVRFNNELWRIIGVFDTDDGTGKIEKRIKIVRNESIGDYAWNSDYSNEWSTATLNTILNTGSYYTNVTDTAKEMIENTKWYLGAINAYGGVPVSMSYACERGTEVYSGNSTNWLGKVGLIYPSDYGYATSGGSTTGKSSCVSKAMYDWSDSSYSDCKNNDWLFNSINYWLLSSQTSDGYGVFLVNSNGAVTIPYVYNAFGVRPTVYLKSTISITSGTGSSTDPFILAQS